MAWEELLLYAPTDCSEGTEGAGLRALSSYADAIMEALAAQFSGCVWVRLTRPSVLPRLPPHHMTLAEGLTPRPGEWLTRRFLLFFFFSTECRVRLNGSKSGAFLSLCFFFVVVAVILVA